MFQSKENDTQEKTVIDTTKDYHKETFIYENKNDSWEAEVYIGKGDTIVNQEKYYKSGILDSTKSTFYNLKLNYSENNDSIANGNITLNLPKAGEKLKLTGQEIQFSYIQSENDSIYFKEVKTDKNNIAFEYKKFKDDQLEGVLWILRTFRHIPDNDSLLFTNQIMLIDNKIYTNNPFIGMDL